MPIQYRCGHCQQLLSISSRKLGLVVDCPICGRPSEVAPLADFAPLADPAPPIAATGPVELTSPTESTPPAEVAEFAESDFARQTPPPVVPRESAVARQPLAPRDSGVSRRAVSPLPPSAEPVSPARRRSKTVAIEPGADPELASAAPEANASAIDDGGFRMRKPQTVFDDMDLTPMVDVTFLLLIFFMVTASFSLQKTIEFPPPDQAQKGASQSLSIEDLQDNTVFVKIDDQNAIFVDDELVTEVAKLAEVLRRARITSQRSELAIDAAAETFHEQVIAVIDAATAAGMQKIRLVSRAGRESN